MSRKFRSGIVALLLAGALTVALTGTALAQEEPPTPETTPFHGRGFGRGMGGHEGLEIVADMLEFETVAALIAELRGGTTLAELAENANVELQDIQDAVTAARDDAMRESIKQAVEDGNLDAGKAEWLLQGLENGFLGGQGFNMFGGMGGCGGRGGFRAPGGFGRPGWNQNSAPATGTNL